MAKPVKPEKWLTGTGDPLTEYGRTLQKMKMVLLNTPREKLVEFNKRFETELKALEALIEIDESYEVEGIIDHEKHWGKQKG